MAVFAVDKVDDFFRWNGKNCVIISNFATLSNTMLDITSFLPSFCIIFI